MQSLRYYKHYHNKITMVGDCFVPLIFRDTIVTNETRIEKSQIYNITFIPQKIYFIIMTYLY